MIRILLCFVPVLMLVSLAIALPSPWAGVAALGAMIAFPLCGMWALRREDQKTTAHATRAGLAGWVSGSF